MAKKEKPVTINIHSVELLSTSFCHDKTGDKVVLVTRMSPDTSHQSINLAIAVGQAERLHGDLSTLLKAYRRQVRKGEAKPGTKPGG